MAWETRNGRQYYYRVRWANGCVEKTYLGAGDAAKQAAEKDAAAKAQWAANKAEVAELEAKLSGVDQLVTEVQRGVDVLTEATLLVLGYHEHHGQWRKHRNVDQAG
jgi:hypothetical protein